jgi:hypothetical protein
LETADFLVFFKFLAGHPIIQLAEAGLQPDRDVRHG